MLPLVGPIVGKICLRQHQSQCAGVGASRGRYSTRLAQHPVGAVDTDLVGGWNKTGHGVCLRNSHIWPVGILDSLWKGEADRRNWFLGLWTLLCSGSREGSVRDRFRESAWRSPRKQKDPANRVQ
jgi:hypothetical protein